MTNPRDHATHPHRVEAHAATDSAGAPWQERILHPSGFEADTGQSDPALVAAMAGEDDMVLMSAVASGRFLVAVVPHAQEIVTDERGLAHDPSVEMALVTLTAPDGRRAIPAFTGIAELAQWDPAARPVPVTADKLAQAAVSEGCEVIVLDLDQPHARELRPSQVWALAMDRPWSPPERDSFVDAAVGRVVAREGEVTAYRRYAADPPGTLGVELTLVPGLDRASVTALVTRIGEQLATDGEFRARIDGLAFRIAGSVVPAGE